VTWTPAGAVGPTPLSLISAHSPPMQLVLDPFIGSGNTAIAALTLGRRVVGVDVSQQYLDVAEAKIRELEQRLPLDITVATSRDNDKAAQRNSG
jgi:DNA modification methylase